MSEAEQETLELRLLTDPEFGEEFDTIVDELTDAYVQNELSGDERERAEKFFLNTTERQHKLHFASELLRRAEDERGQRTEVRTVAPAKPGLFEQFRAFWSKQSFAPLAATAAAVVVAVVLLIALIPRGNPSSANYAVVNLTITAADRATGAAPHVVPMPESGLRINLTIPEQDRGAKDYSVKLIDGKQVEQDLQIEERNEQSITVAVPAASLSRGEYAIQVWKKSDAGEERVPGSYRFNVE